MSARRRRGPSDGARRGPRVTIGWVLLGVVALACSDEGSRAAASDPGGAAGSASEPAPGTTGDVPAETPDVPPPCPWEPADLLSQVGVSAPDIPQCVSTGSEGEIPRDCFLRAMAAAEPAQFTSNDCIDCLILSTYVTLPDAGEFRLYREADWYGDSLREVRVESCTDIVPSLSDELGCKAPSKLYECSDPLPSSL